MSANEQPSPRSLIDALSILRSLVRLAYDTPFCIVNWCRSAA
jgi:hypothetical protein